MRRRHYESPPPWFGEVLKKHRTDRGESINDLMERTNDLKVPEGLPSPNPSMFRRLESNESKQFNIQDEAHLLYLSKVYDIDLSLLTSVFAAPVAPYVLLKKPDFSKESEEGNFRELQDLQGAGSLFFNSKQRLKSAPQSVYWGQLEQGGESRTHSHPGYEIIIVMKGRLTMTLEKRDAPQQVVEMNEGDTLHFQSEYTHTARNEGRETAEYIVIRSFIELSEE